MIICSYVLGDVFLWKVLVFQATRWRVDSTTALITRNKWRWRSWGIRTEPARLEEQTSPGEKKWENTIIRETLPILPSDIAFHFHEHKKWNHWSQPESCGSVIFLLIALIFPSEVPLFHSLNYLLRCMECNTINYVDDIAILWESYKNWKLGLYLTWRNSSKDDGWKKFCNQPCS